MNIGKTLLTPETHFAGLFKPRRLVGIAPVLALLWMIAVTAGCRTFGPAPAEQATYYSNPAKLPSSVSRVAVIEFYNQSAYPQVSAEMTDAVYQALQKKHIFGLFVIRASDPAWKNLQIHPESPYTLEQLLATRKAIGGDAVLVGTVTHYLPYPHMSLGLRLKLIDLYDGQLLWAFEQFWDTADKATEERIKKYFQDELRGGFAPLKQELVNLSPMNFAKFVSYEVAQTVQPNR